MRALLASLGLGLLLAGCAAGPAEPSLILGTTTTTQDSGILDALLPAFERDAGIRAKAVVGGSGEILAKAARGDVDVVLSHSPEAEAAFLAAGEAASRRPVMRNAFLVVGPSADPAGVADAPDVHDAFRRLHERRADVTFASRGDESGTHARELALWASAGLDVADFDPSWYKQTGSGQAPTLLYADEAGAYALSDQATWATLREHDRLPHLAVLFRSADAEMRNDYAVLTLNATRHPDLHQAEAETFAQWLAGPQGQAVIAAFRAGGEPVFFPAAPVEA